MVLKASWGVREEQDRRPLSSPSLSVSVQPFWASGSTFTISLPWGCGESGRGDYCSQGRWQSPAPRTRWSPKATPAVYFQRVSGPWTGALDTWPDVCHDPNSSLASLNTALEHRPPLVIVTGRTMSRATGVQKSDCSKKTEIGWINTDMFLDRGITNQMSSVQFIAGK